jgi:phosphoribosyl 1,2-cyclic phosphodiesterase
MQVRFCGVRGSTSAPGIQYLRYGGHTCCLALSHDHDDTPRLVLDAGTGLRAATPALDGQPFTGTILLTHLHWDHILELPFFAAGDRPDAKPTVLLPEQEDRRDALSVLEHIMSPPYFPIRPTQLRGEWTFDNVAPGEHAIEGFTVLAREIPHKGGRTFGYRISDQHSTLTYMPDHCPTMLGSGEHGFGQYHPAALELAHEADLLVHDAQLFPHELAAEANFGHSVVDYPVELAKRAHARTVALFHHRYDRSDEALDQLAQRLGRDAPGEDGSPAVSVAAGGAVVQL